ncbi:MAG: alpha/beta hydrolase, partial [Deltaproteobacteria bacterium]|nr:alpha/beta hydrolase [Deltaproteobacteria bacterium]
APSAPAAPSAAVGASGYGGSFAAGPGRARARLRVAGLEREMTVYVPRSRGAAPPLVLLFHGTNATGDVAIDESGAQAMADGAGAVVVAPDARWMPQGDWDHATEETYWQTAPETNPARNADLLLVQAIMAEARLRFGVDPARVYAFGHSNGGFFATLVATQLRARIAGFATSSAGLVRCATTSACRFEGRGASCAALRTQRGWCRCEGPDRPGEVPTVGRLPPAYLTHGTRDPMVSVQYTCELAGRLQAAGAAVSLVLRDGDGHVVPPTFARDAWAFLAGRRLP